MHAHLADTGGGGKQPAYWGRATVYLIPEVLQAALPGDFQTYYRTRCLC